MSGDDLQAVVPVAGEAPSAPLDTANLPPAALLRRCHRDELDPLAHALRVNPDGLGLSKLASVIEGALRRAGGHELGNMLRGGEGPPYQELLADLAERCGVQPGPDFDSTEVALLAWWMREAWPRLDLPQKTVLWAHMGASGDPPPAPQAAVDKARKDLGPGFGYSAGMLALGGVARVATVTLLPMLGPLAGIAMIAWLARPKDEILLPAVLELSRLRQAVRHRVTVGVVGSPSSGKDAAIRAIFGIDSGNINPVAGSTRQVAITRLPGATALYVVNTPGMGDVVEAVTEEARQVLDHIDIYLYVLNAQGGVQARELDDWRSCQNSKRPCAVVVNKIDTLRERDRERYLADAREKLGAPQEDFMAAAMDPLPQLADGPIGLGPIRAWIERKLSNLGKDLSELPWVDHG